MNDKLIYKPIIKNKIYQDAEVLFNDDPELKAFYMKKINKEFGKLSYVNENLLRDMPMSFQEASTDLIYREYSYMQRIRTALSAMSNIKENLNINISKNNIVDAVSINGVLTHLNYDYAKDFTKAKQSKRPKTSYGSSTIGYVTNIKNIFAEEVNKLDKIKAHKFKELDIPSIDEAMATRKDLIETYTSKIAEFEKMKNERIEEEIKEELDNFKFEYFINGENLGSLEEKNPNFEKIGDFNGVNLLDLENELIKKEYEIIQNTENNPENSEEYKDVSSLVKNISTLKKLEDSNNEENYLNKSERMLNKARLMNKGYAFATMITSNEAIRLYLEAQLGLKIKNKICDIEPKFDQTHNSMDIEKLIANSKKDTVLLGKEDEIKISEKKIFTSSLNMYLMICGHIISAKERL